MTAPSPRPALSYKELPAFLQNIWHSIPELESTSLDGMTRDLNPIALHP